MSVRHRNNEMVRAWRDVHQQMSKNACVEMLMKWHERIWTNQRTTDWLTDWLTDCLTVWLTDWMNKRMNEWTNERMNEWTNERMNEWTNEWPNERLKWNEMNWIELNLIELNWNGMKWNEMKRNWTEMKWDWNEMNWVEFNWTELKWNEMNEWMKHWKNEATNGWVSYFIVAFLLDWTTSSLRYRGTRSLSYLFSGQPLVWGILLLWPASALSCLPFQLPSYPFCI